MMTKLEKFCINWLNKNYGELESYETEIYPNQIFYLKNGNRILDYNKKTGVVYVSYGEIWSFFKSFFGMEYQQIQDITKRWVEEHYKMGVTTTIIRFYNERPRWRNTTK